MGKVSEQLLLALGISKCGDLCDRRDDIVLLFSQVSASFFPRTAMASSANTLSKEGERKSMSTERLATNCPYFIHPPVMSTVEVDIGVNKML